MEQVPQTPQDFFLLLLSGSGVLFGLLSVWLTDRVIEIWQGRVGRVISATKQRWISIAVPIGLVLLGYAGAVLLGAWPLTAQTAYDAALAALASVGTKQAAFAALRSARKPKVPAPAPAPPPG